MRLYRCLYDGKFVPDLDKKPSVCPNCNRNTLPTTVRRPKRRALVFQQVKIKDTYFTYEIEGNPSTKWLQNNRPGVIS
jgi:hypothetical protein